MYKIRFPFNIRVFNNLVNSLSLFFIVFNPDLSCRSRLANLNDRLNYLEKKVDYIEASVSSYNITVDS